MNTVLFSLVTVRQSCMAADDAGLGWLGSFRLASPVSVMEPPLITLVGLNTRPPARKPLPRVRKSNLHSDRGQDSNPCAWRPLEFPKHVWFHCPT
ncbi:hypothetical protein E2C01_066655 [Portunus trituberculatus]|uniref:Uncharacterized protein n=1 Tax=Portunus trituberculatus TaxID=210409 RepID=A0A5B7HM39_PORTR|nr:hypothetical protein [Portunus trituberculatus]